MIRRYVYVGYSALKKLLLFGLLLPISVLAQTGPASLNLSGGLFNPNGTAILDTSVNFKIDVYDASATCLLYSEQHLGQNLSQTKGGFSLQLGSGTSQINYLENTTNFDRTLFVNSGAVAAFSGCPSGLTFNVGDTRVIRVSYDVGQGFVSMTPDVPITNTPYAMVADTLQGLPAAGFVQTDAASLTQSNVANIFSNINYPKLEALLSGSSTQYIPSAPGSSVSFNGQLLTNIANPTAPQDAATKNYADNDLGGLPITIAGIGAGMGGGKTLVWDQVADAWVAQTAGTVTYVGSGTGLIGGNFSQQGTLSVDVGTSANKILQLTATAQLPGVDGSLLFNVNATRLASQSVSTVAPSFGQILGWNSSSAQWEPQVNGGITALTGDVRATGPGSVAATIQPNAVNLASKINNGGNGPNQLLITDPTTGQTVGYGTCAIVGEVYQWTASGWQCVNVSTFLGNSSVGAGTYGTATMVPQISVDSTGRVTTLTNVNIAFPVTSVAGRTGDVVLNAADISGLGTAATQNYGTAPLNLVQLDAGGMIPLSELPTGTGTITGVIAGTALLGGGTSGVVTLSVDVGVTANKVIQFNAQAKYPSNDGSLITNVNATRIASRTLSTAAPGLGQFIGWNASSGEWEPTTGNSGSVTSVQTSTGLLGGTITSAGTLSVDVGTAPLKIVQFLSTAQYPANDGFLIANVNAAKLRSVTVSTVLPNAGQVLAYNQTNQDWEPTFETTGTVTNVTGGTGLLGGAITTNGTLNVDVGTAAGKILQVTAGGLYPADDGSLLSNLNASRIGTRTVSTNGPGSGQVLAWNSTNGDWEPTSETTGTVTSVSGGIGLLGGAITSSGTLNIDVGTAANKILQVTSTGLYPADDGSLLSNLNASRIGTRAVSTNGPIAGQVLGWNTTNSDWEPTAASTGSVQSVVSGIGLVANTITQNGTLTIDVGTAANKILQVTSTGLYPADDGSLLSNLNASRIGTRAVSTNGPGAGQVLGWNTTNSDWEPTTASTGSVQSVVSGTGLVANTITQNGTLAIDVGTAANKILQVTSTGLYPADDGSLISNLNATRIGTRTVSTNGPGAGQVLGWNTTNSDWEPTAASTGSVQSVVSGTGLVANTITQNGTLAIDVGTAANKILQVTSTGLYPADDGSLLSNLNASRIGTRAISTNGPIAGQVLGWNTTNSDWEPTAASTGSVQSVVSGLGLVANTITQNGTLAIDVGTAANKILQVTSTGLYPADDGSLISNLNASRIGTRAISTNGPGAGQVLGWNTTNSDWEPTAASTGSVQSVVSGTGLVASTITQNGTLAIDVGTAANKILQVTSTGLYPADDGSLLSNLNASRIGTRAVSTAGPGAGQVLGWNATNSDWEPITSSTGSVQSVVSGTGLVANTITQNGTLAIDVGTAANKILQVTSTGLYPADDGSLISNLNASRIGTRAVSTNGPGAGQVLGWNTTNSDWEPVTSSTGSVQSVVSGTGLVANTITQNGTLVIDVGTAANKILQVTSSGLYPADDGSLISNLNATRIGTRAVSTNGPIAGQVLGWNTTNSDWEPVTSSTGSVQSVVSGTGLVANTITQNGTLAIDVGTAANKILQVTSTGLYPADDGSLLSNLNATRIGTRAVSTNGPGAGQVLGWNTTNSDWEPTAASTGSVQSVVSGTGLVANTITQNGTLAIDVGTAANKILQVTSTGLYPADDGSLLSNLNASRIGTRAVSTNGPGTGQVLGWNTTNSDWEPTVASTGSVQSVVSGTGLVANTITQNGTLAIDVGTAANKILQVTSTGLYPPDDGSLISNLNATRIGTRAVSTNGPIAGQVLGWNTTNSDWEPITSSTGSVQSVVSGTGLVANTITQNGTLTIDVGTAANKILQVTSTGLYPADDGSLLSNLNASRIGTRAVSTNGPGAGQVLGWNTTNSDWEPITSSTGTVQSVVSGTGLVANTITQNGTLAIDVGTAANKILQVTSTGLYPADDGSLLSNVNASRIGTRAVSTNGPGAGQVLGWNTTNSDWEPTAASTGSVQSVVSGTGLIANTITQNGTIAIDVGTAANKILQVTSTGLYPADDGSLISNLNATRIGTRTVSTNGPGAGQVLGWNTTNSDWEPITSSTGTVQSVVSGTGLVANTITQNGTLAIDVGTAANKILQVTSTGLYPADDGSLISNLNASRIGTRAVSTNTPGGGQVLGWNTTNSDWEPVTSSTGSVQSVVSGTGLVANTITQNGTLAIDVGTAANKILQVTSTGLYPADDGSLLSNLNASRIGTRAVSTNGPGAGQVLGWNTTNSNWEPTVASTGSVQSVVSGTGLVANTITQNGTLAIDVGTAANKILQVTSTGLYPADDGSLLSNLNATRIGTRTVSTNGPGAGQVLGWNTTNSDWEPTVASTGSVQSVVSGTGLVANTITQNGTLAIDVGTAANKILQVTSTGLYPADDGSLLSNLNASRIGARAVSTNGPIAGQVLGWNTTNSDWEPITSSTGSVQSVVSGTGLVANTITQNGTLAIDVGTAANKILQVTSTGLYPADDGSLLSNLNASRIGARAVSTNGPIAGQVLGWNTTNSDWEPITSSTGSVQSVVSGTGLVANTITQNGTLAIDVGTAANKILQVTSTGLYPADDGSLLSNLNASRIGTRAVSTNGPSVGQVLGWNTINSDWEPTAASTGSVQSVVSGIGLVANTITQNGTLAIDVGTAANKILQVTSTGLYPADDGSLISNLNASRIGTRAVSTNGPGAGQVLGWNTTNSDWEPVTSSTGSVQSVVSGTGLVANTITQNGTLAIDVGTAANKILQVTSTGLYPADDGSLLSNLNASRIGTRAVSTNGPSVGQVLGWNTINSDWEPTAASTGSVQSVVSGIGLVANTITQNGTLAIDVGTAANKILQVTSTGLYPADDGSLISNLNATRIGTRAVSTNGPGAGQVLGWNTTNSDWEPTAASTGSVQSVVSGTGLVANTITQNGTLAIDVGTAANKILQVTSTGLYPADDGSLLSNLNASRIGTRAVSTNGPGAGQVLGWNTTNSDWEPITSSTGTVQSVVSGTGLVANTITQNGTLVIDVGTAANKILQVTSTGLYPADDGSLLSNLNASRIGTHAVSTNGPIAGQVLGWNTTNSDWEPTAASTGSVQSVVSGAGLVANTITQNGTLAIDVGTAANKILQVTSTGLYPADDGSLISNLNATRIGTRSVSTNGPGAGQVLGWNATNSDWEPTAASTGSVQSVVSGTGLVANTITQNGTLAIDVGTAANKILQVTSTGVYPQDDGYLISNINAIYLAGKQLSLSNATAGQVLTYNGTLGKWDAETSNALTGFVNGGNSFGSSATLGTNDNNSLAFKTNNSAAMTILANGNVGIGTTAPVGLLNVFNNSAALNSGQTTLVLNAFHDGTTPVVGSGAKINFKQGTGTDTAAIRSYTFGPSLTGLSFDTGWGALTSKMVIDNSGNVGIGTSAPAAALDVLPTGTSGDLQVLASGFSNQVKLQAGAGGAGTSIRFGSTLIGDSSASNLGSSTNYWNAAYITNGYFSANVGIGTAAPAAMLDIYGLGTGQSAIIVPRDTVANRPSTPVNGMIRYASDTGKFEVYQSGSWQNMIAATNGTLTSLTGGTGLIGGTVSSIGTLSVDVGTAANKILQVTSTGLYPSDDGSLISNLNATRIGTRAVSTNGPGAGQVLGWNTTNSDWEPTAASTGSVQSVVSGTGLVASTITQNGTLAVDVGTAANKILQVTSAGVYPQDDGYLISNINATSLAGKLVSLSSATAGQVLTYNGSLNKWDAETSNATTAFVNGGNSFGSAATLGTNDSNSLSLKTNNSVAMTILTNGFIGIGTTSPTSKLQVVGGSIVGQLAGSSYGETLGLYSGLGDIHFTVNNGSLVPGTAALGTASYHNLALLANNNVVEFLSPSGNVGIGTTSPQATLDVRSDSALFGSGGSGGLISPYLGFAGQNPAWVQIYDGTSTSANTNYAALNLAANQTGTGKLVGTINFNNASLGSNYNRVAAISGGTDVTGTNSGQLVFQVTNAGTSATDMTIVASGSVGVGTSSPKAILDVYGLTSQSALIVPRDTTANRPTSAVNGMIRYASDTGKFEAYQSGTWTNLIAGSSTSGVALSNITAATASNTIDNTNFAQTWNWSSATSQSPLSVSANSLTTGSALSLSSSSSALNSTNGLLSVANTSTSTSGMLAQFQSNSSAGSGLYVLANGNVGIGTANPGYNLLVNGTASTSSIEATGGATAYTNSGGINMTFDGQSGNIRAYTSNSGAGTANIAFFTGGSERVRINSSGNVGIGTAAPLTRLNVLVANTGSTLDGLQLNDGTHAAALSLTQASYTFGPSIGGNETWLGASTAIDVGSYNVAPTKFVIGGAEKMRVDSSGNVGIGTTSPSVPLQVEGKIQSDSSNQYSVFELSHNGTGRTQWAWDETHSISYIQTDSSTYDIGLSPNYTNRFIVKASTGYVGIGSTAPAGFLDVEGSGNILLNAGNVGIGTTSPANTLVVRSGADQNLAILGHSSFSTGVTLSAYNDAISSNVPMEFHSSVFDFTGGNVGIGTTSPTSTLEVSGGAIVSDSVTNTVAYINFGAGNVQMTSSSANVINICGLKDGGSYTLVLTGVAASSTVTINAYPTYVNSTSCSGTAIGVDLGAGATSFTTSGNTNILSFIYFSGRGTSGTVYGVPATNYNL